MSQEKAPDCDLCEAARFTEWFHEDDVCWIAECEVCSVPMVVWRWHGTEPPEADVEHMLSRLAEVADRVFSGEDYNIDRTMRQIPDHFHAHARDRNWWYRRFT
ncbi:MAG: hypothetical protein ACR2H3_11320 [Acidimicrobiales bacterium]